MWESSSETEYMLDQILIWTAQQIRNWPAQLLSGSGSWVLLLKASYCNTYYRCWSYECICCCSASRGFRSRHTLLHSLLWVLVELNNLLSCSSWHDQWDSCTNNCMMHGNSVLLYKLKILTIFRVINGKYAYHDVVLLYISHVICLRYHD